MITEHEKILRRAQKRRKRERNIAAGLTGHGQPRRLPPRAPGSVPLTSTERANRAHAKNGRHDSRRLMRDYGITEETYDAMLETQNGKCAICEQPPRNRRLSVDHCHKTGRVRKLLCDRCNTALGCVNDDPTRIMALHAYAVEYYIAPAKRRCAPICREPY